MKFVHSPIAKLLVLTLIVVAPLVSRADLITMLGDHSQPNEQTVVFNGSQVGNSVLGVTNLTSNQVWFTSSTDQLATYAGGRSLVTSAIAGDLINHLVISASGMAFTNFILDPLMLRASSVAGGPFDLAITLKTNTGTYVFAYPSMGADSLSGGNYISFLATGGTLINEVDITSTSGFEGLSPIRVAGVVAAAPEPASLMLLGVGLAMLPIRLRRRS